MIRCPFNNFSKCDGSCPFSMPDFTGCRIATSLTTIEGIVRGIDGTVRNLLIQTNNINARIEQMNASESSATPKRKRTSNALESDPTRDRLMIRHRTNSKTLFDIRLVLTAETAREVLDMFGDRLDVNVTPNGKIFLLPGNALKITSNGATRSTRQISLAKYASIITDAYNETHGAVYLEKRIIDDMMIFAQDENKEVA